MDLAKKVKRALEKSFHPERVELKENEGISGYIVAAQFRKMTDLDRQWVIHKALRESSAKLSREDLRRVTVIAALTPEEYIAHGIED